jgi:hypothetical protein
MLQLHQRTFAPNAVSVSISTAVWIVICRLPTMFRPFSGCLRPYSSRHAIRPGISCSASMISLRPHSAAARNFSRFSMSRTLNSSGCLAGFDLLFLGGVSICVMGGCS